MKTAFLVFVVVILTLLSGCDLRQTVNSGFVDDQDTLNFIVPGTSQEQVLLSLGSPSTTRKEQQLESYYYISQKRVRNFYFQKFKLVDQTVTAIYFDRKKLVKRVARYGLKDGKVFDFVTQTTPGGGRDLSFLRNILYRMQKTKK